MSAINGHIELQRGDFRLDTSLALADRGVTAICGSSGAGKTSLLRCIAGLERPAAGRLEVDGETWFDEGRFTPPHRRAVGYVTQEPNLFAHLNVIDNLCYGVSRTRAPARIDEGEVIDGLGLDRLLTRDVATLSGGERQRVAIGRALLRSPVVLLLDEPISALDIHSRTEVLRYIAYVLQRLRVRCLYVSHDLREAAKLADEMIWMEAGRIVAQGPTQSVLTDLRLPFAEQDDAECVIDGVIEAHDTEMALTKVRCAGGALWMPVSSQPIGSKVPIQIAARDVSLALARPHEVSILNILEGRIADIATSARFPAHSLVRIDVGEQHVLARITRKSVAALGLRRGSAVWALVKAVALAQ